MCCQNVDMRRFENNVDLSACVNVETMHISLQQGLEVDGNIDLYLPQGIEKYVNGRTYIKKKKKKKKNKKEGLLSMQEFTSRKGTHYVRIYTRWNCLLFGNYVMENAT